MKGYDKYERGYFMPPECTYDWVKKEYIDKAPLWCSVDLPVGNVGGGTGLLGCELGSRRRPESAG